MRKSTRKQPPIHPGEILSAEFIEPLGLTAYRVAKQIHVPLQRLGAIVAGKRSVSADTALRLGRFFGTSAAFWMNLQTHYDLEIARDQIGAQTLDEIDAHVAA